MVERSKTKITINKTLLYKTKKIKTDKKTDNR